MIDLTPPHNLELEQSVLATVLSFPSDELFILRPSDFYRTAHAKIYKTCLELHNTKKPVDITSVTNEFLKSGLLSEIGGAGYLSEIMDCPTLIDNEYSVEQLRGFADLRRMIEVSNAVMKKCYRAKPEDVEKISGELQKAALGIGGFQKDSFCKLSDVISETVEYCESLQAQGGITGVPTGFKLLDSLLCGFQPGDLIILAGRPSMGKTAFAVNCMINAAKEDYAADFFSLEMARRQIGTRFIAVESRINSQKFRSGKFIDDDWLKIIAAADKLYRCPINIDDNPCATYQELQRKARKSFKANGTKAIWIDYLSFIEGDKGSSVVKEVESVTRGMKALAKELNIPVILLCQLNRLCEQRNNKRPMLSDLRDSGAIEQDADVVIFLYRDEVYNEQSEDKGIAEIIVAKQRSGPTGVVPLVWLEKYTRFEDLTRNYEA